METQDLAVEGWRRVVHFRDPEAQFESIIAVHDSTLGPGCGGCRLRPYENVDAALEDVKNLSRGMTYKNALGGIPFGGGKAVIIANPHTDKSPALFEAFGRAVEHMDGLYYTAEDSGVNEHDLQIAHGQTRYVAGLGLDGKGGNPSPFTARGVWRGIEAAVKARLQRETLDGLRVGILGVGAVGMELARLLHSAGASLVVADVNEAAVKEAIEKYGAEAISPDACIEADVDVFSPCALGGSINRDSVHALKACIVAGAANNQLKTADMDQALKDKNVLYAPDYVINGAGVISVGLEILDTWTAEEMTRRIDAIGDTLANIFDRAEKDDKPTGAVADEMALDIIAKAHAAA